MSNRRYFAALKSRTRNPKSLQAISPEPIFLTTPPGVKMMPKGQNDWNQILAGKRQRAKGDLSQLRSKLLRAITVVEAGMFEAMERRDEDSVIRWVHCLTQLGSVYGRITLDSDIESRIKALEDARK